jgi:hypothetical protein
MPSLNVKVIGFKGKSDSDRAMIIRRPMEFASQFYRSGFKASDQAQGQGVLRIGMRVSERTREYVRISIRACGELSRAGTTQPLGLRWEFDTTSNDYRNIGAAVKIGFCPPCRGNSLAKILWLC